MKDEMIVSMIEDYLSEPSIIDKQWVDALQICKELLEARIGTRYLGCKIAKEYVKGETNK
ncbi:MAG: hypothetical protein EOM50_12040 [Erysipelotrichia bacterium]|nr:hypothetical protein [Erysipelotrichia bacterium]